MRERFIGVARKAAVMLAAGALYITFVYLAGFGIPCMFHVVTGLYCPGCGITRMFTALLKLDFTTAIHSNAAVFFALPLFAVFFCRRLVIYIRRGEKPPQNRAENILLYAFVAVLVIFGIVRNLPMFEFLNPIF